MGYKHTSTLAQWLPQNQAEDAHCAGYGQHPWVELQTNNRTQMESAEWHKLWSKIPTSVCKIHLNGMNPEFTPPPLKGVTSRCTLTWSPIQRDVSGVSMSGERWRDVWGLHYTYNRSFSRGITGKLILRSLPGAYQWWCNHNKEIPSSMSPLGELKDLNCIHIHWYTYTGAVVSSLYSINPIYSRGIYLVSSYPQRSSWGTKLHPWN